MEPMIEIRAIDDAMLDQLVEAAIAGAHPDDVTPPLGQGWTLQRIAWLRRFHRERAIGFAGPLAERTWAILEDGWVVGSVRLHLLTPARGEVGIWLTRATRGRRIGTQAVAAVIDVAAAAGLTTVAASTTRRNAAALGLLEHLEFELTDQGGEQVTAVLRLS